MKKNWIQDKLLVTVCTLIALFSISMLMFGFVVTKDVTIIDGERKIETTSNRLYVEELLAEQKITLNTGDKISVPLHSMLRHNSTITIQRGKCIVVHVEGKSKAIYSCAATLGEALTEYSISLGAMDDISHALDTPVTNGMQVTISRVRVYEETLTETVPAPVIIQPNYEKRTSHEVVLSEGADGTSKRTYKVVIRDGKEESREIIKEDVLVPTQDRIIEKGIQGEKVLPTSTEHLQVKKIIDVKATAYSFNVGNITASGRHAAYGVIAVDPRLIPLGSKLYIEAPDGSWTYGFAIAGDTGGAIKGNRIDLFYNTVSECISFGYRPARVYVLE